MEKQFDVIVVGAGNGGLTAAANTAKAGLKTLLLETHHIPGGCATSFRRGRRYCRSCPLPQRRVRLVPFQAGIR